MRSSRFAAAHRAWSAAAVKVVSASLAWLLCASAASAQRPASDSARARSGPAVKSTTSKTTPKKSPPAAATPKTVEPPKWPVDAPDPLPGSILPTKRIVAFYGNPLSKRMGVLGELATPDMLAKLDQEVAAWNAADPQHPVQPALHLIAVVAQGTPGVAGKYRMRMDSALIEKVYGWAKSKNAILFLDVQVGQGTLQEELPRLVPFLSRPDVHLAIDPEFSMKHNDVPGTRIGTFNAEDINYASGLLRDLVTQLHLPPKILIVHRFTRDMLTGYKRVVLDPRVQIVINMDGWGPPALKRESYRAYVYSYPVEYTGFKLFYHNDTKKKGSTLMTPADVLALNPKPLYIQYQ
jgi:hypothetical protein